MRNAMISTIFTKMLILNVYNKNKNDKISLNIFLQLVQFLFSLYQRTFLLD